MTVTKKKVATKKTTRKRSPSKPKELPTKTHWCVLEEDSVPPADIGCILYVVDVDGDMSLGLGRWSSVSKVWLTMENTALEEECSVQCYAPVFLPNGKIWKL